MTQLIGTSFGDPPYYYDKGEELTVVFKTDRDILASVLPPVLELPDGPGLGVLRVVHHVRSSFGPYIGVYLAGRALLNGELVQHCLTGLKTNFVGAVAGREIWGMPLQVGEATMEWDGDLLMVAAGRRGVDFVRLALRLDRRVEAPKPGPMLTYATKRQSFDGSDVGHVLLSARGQVEDPSAVRHWTAKSVLKLVGGDPGDDWSMIPVHEVVETRMSTGGHSSLDRGAILAEW